MASEVGADLFPLDVLTPEQSLSLLAAHLGRDLAPAEEVEARRLAEAVGFLPLALVLAAARVRRGMSWTELRRALEAEVARLEELENPRRRRAGQAWLKASFNLSLGALRAEDRAAYEAFVRLGLLPEDAAIAAPMAATLRDVEEAEAAVLLDLLRGESLLLPGTPVWIGERTLPAYRLHDLLHDLARHLLTAPSTPTRPDDLPGLGLTLLEQDLIPVPRPGDLGEDPLVDRRQGGRGRRRPRAPVGTRIETRGNQPLGFATWETSGALRICAIRKLTPAEVAAINDSKK